MFRKFWIYISLGLITFLGCQKEKAMQHSYTIAFSQCIGSDDWRQTMLKEMKRELSFHPNVKFIYTDAEGNSQKQIEQVRNLLTQHIDLLIISPNEAKPLTPLIDSIFKNDIPVIVTDRKTSSGLYNAYVGADNYAIGQLAAKYLTQHLPRDSRIGLVTGLPGTSASLEREKGFRETLSNSSNLSITKAVSGEWLQSIARKKVSENIIDFSNVDAVFAFNDQMAFGAMLALKPFRTSKDIAFIGVDALPGKGNGLEQILSGSFRASLLYPTGGSESIKTALAILNHNNYLRENLLNTAVVDSTNASLLNLQYQKIDQQQSDIDKQQTLLQDQQKIYNSQRTILNVLIVSLVLAIIFGGIAIVSLKSNWEKNKHLELQNNEIVEQQTQLIQMSNEVKASSDARSKFFTNISHEFKTPLTLIITPLEDLLDRKDVPQEIAYQFERMKRNAEKLLNLVNELIDIQRFSRDRIRLKAFPNDLNKFMNRIVQDFKPLSIKRKIAISYSNPTSINELWFDTGLMEKVFDNLLSNALKFTEKHGRIEIRTELNQFGDHLLIRIIDNGKGIGREHIDHIFEPFYQGIRSNEGSGIGLALAKEIVIMHHGQITVSSRENEGTSFTLRLPVGHEHLNTDEKQNDRESQSQPIALTHRVPLLDENDNIGEHNRIAYQGHEHHILIVDDHYDVLDYLIETLQGHYNVYTASSAETGIKTALKVVPDLIISDVMMPGKSGLDLLKTLKKEPRTSHIPIILLSAVDSEQQKLEGARAMADGYITKPFHLDRLLATVDSLIKSRAHLREKYKSEIDIPPVDSDKTVSDVDRIFLNNLSALVESHLTDTKLNVEAIAEKMNLSRVQLYRKVKALLDCGVNDYILNRRLKKAKHLIREGHNINEIAEKVGFASPTYFATAFKKAFGLSPSAFKKNQVK